MSRQLRKRIFFNPPSTIKKARYEFKLAWGSAPHPEKAWKGGQDALYVSTNILIVADGVSGWSQMGIDAGIYARKLIALAKELVQSENEMYFIEKPQELAIKIVQSNHEKGSSTLTILTLHPYTGMLRSYHVGDSVFGLFRKNGATIIAEEQQKQFNVPYQVFGGNINIINNQENTTERQMVSDVFQGHYNQFGIHQLTESSIVLASDGLWDNVHTEQIKNEIFLIEGIDLVQKTMNLIRKVKYYSELPSYESPFYHKALKVGQTVAKSGKIDDTTIILAEIISIQI